jgi:2'-hydroxyisoflavone reductase
VAEQRVLGTFNATGPRAPLDVAGLLHGVRAATSADRDVRFTWVSTDFLNDQKVSPWSDLPVWLPRSLPDSALSEVSNKRAVESGLTFRPLAQTVADTMTWFRSLPTERQVLRSGLKAERESEVLRAWQARPR